MGNKPSAEVNTAQAVHAPTPWYIHPDSPSVIREPENDCIVCYHCDINDARFIVRAVNSHDELIGVLKRCKYLLAVDCDSRGQSPEVEACRAAIRNILHKCEVQS